MSNHKKIVILSVTNDLTTDQRVHKVALSLIKSGYKPMLVGRILKNSKPINARSYQTKRMKLFFNKGPFFYAEFNLRLFILLLFLKVDLLIANDLDTLLANYLAFKTKNFILKKKIKLIYDSHEYFTEVPELNGRFAKKVWLLIEKKILPRLKHAYTVCQSIADEYKKRYGLNMFVVRNVPICFRQKNETKATNLLQKEFQGKKILLYQGALNIGRGIEQSILAMHHINNVILLIIGDGDISSDLKKLVLNEKLQEKVLFIGKLPFHDLIEYTKIADLGIILLESQLSLNYYYALPNRLFDYIHAELPIIASDLPEIRPIILENDIGILITEMKPSILAHKINELIENPKEYQKLKSNLKKIKGKYCWEKEEMKLIALFKRLDSF